MESKQHGRTLWDFLSDRKLISWICISLIVIFVIQFILCLTFGLNFKVSFYPNFYYSIEKRENKSNNLIESPFIYTIDTLVAKKYLPIVNDIYQKASKIPGNENQDLRNEYIIVNTKIIKLLNLRNDIVLSIVKDSITEKIYNIETH